MEEHDRIELRSDDVQEIIGTPPRWIVRWGTLIVALSVLAMVSMSFFVKYPDKVKGRVTVTSKVAAVRVKAQQSGRISKIFFEDGDEVMEGDLLVIMQNAANYEDVEELEEIAKALQSADKMELLEFLSSDFKQLDVGTLQPLYSKVENDFENFHFTEMNRSGDKQIFQIRNQIASIRSGINILKRQLKGAEDNVKIEMRKYERLRNLLTSNNVSVQQVENQKKIYNDAKNEVVKINAQINDKWINISHLSTNIQTTQSTSSETNNENLIQLKNSINNLVGAIDRWKEKNLLVAAMDGKISMINNWSEKQYIEQGEEIMAILPKNVTESLFIQLLIPIQGSGKIEVGQQVLLKFDNYPYREFGKVDGEVLELPGLPRENKLPVKIKLTHGLITQSGKELKFEQEMRGEGEIITEDRTVFERIFENIMQPFRQ